MLWGISLHVIIDKEKVKTFLVAPN